MKHTLISTIHEILQKQKYLVEEDNINYYVNTKKFIKAVEALDK